MSEPVDRAPPGKRKSPAEKAREDRLKAALKANMARRKAQARARTAGEAGGGEEPGGPDGQDNG
ncbi:hypothetical protein [Pseudogemmobacter humi]|uniref:hypothetical protein n=1 Tax=Pseudogemmobacter humi TaxID=2483812 RepID=UPI000F5387B9|nr:hypothetical protein [Pseudogemmobacter humi]